MGVLTSGILGAVAGKVGGVVGANWKGVRYVRAYTIPGASNTDAQVAQRARFAAVVIPAKYFVTRIFNPYFDRFLARESGFNRYVSANIPKAPAYTPITAHQVTDGQLYPGSALTASFSSVSGVAALTWGAELGIDGAGTDVGIAWIRSRTTGQVWFSANTTRAAAAVNITGVTETVAANMDCGIFFARMVGTQVNRISRNLNCQPVAA